ncbi:MAG: molybdopterin cofactor-binding domain-containing protein, partial [Comamonas sp.]
MKFFTKDNQAQLTRRQLLKAGGMLMVGSVAGGHLLMAQTAPEAAPKGAFAIPSAKLVDSFIAIGADGSVTAYNGHVDLGTGIRTALGQLVADELYVDFSAVTMVLGHTARTPDLGPTIASNTIQVSSLPMRHAAAQVRQLLIKLASEKSGVPAERITTQKGFVIAGGKRFGYGELVQGQDLQIEVDEKIALRKSGFEYVGKSVQRVDIPNKVLGALTYIHDLRVPGMLHGRVIRPPYTGADATAPLGSSLVSVDEKSIAHLP